MLMYNRCKHSVINVIMTSGNRSDPNTGQSGTVDKGNEPVAHIAHTGVPVSNSPMAASPSSDKDRHMSPSSAAGTPPPVPPRNVNKNTATHMHVDTNQEKLIQSAAGLNIKYVSYH